MLPLTVIFTTYFLTNTHTPSPSTYPHTPPHPTPPHPTNTPQIQSIMKFVLLTIASAKAFAPTTFVRSPSPLSANLVDTIAGLQGPEIYWGSEGIEQGFEEAEIRGYDNFGKLAEAIKGAGLADALNGGEFTLLAPSDSAIEKHINEVGTPIDADILKYHVIPGKISMTGLETDQVSEPHTHKRC